MELERLVVVKVLRDSPQLIYLSRSSKMPGMKGRLLREKKEGISIGIRALPHKLPRG